MKIVRNKKIGRNQLFPSFPWPAHFPRTNEDNEPAAHRTVQYIGFRFTVLQSGLLRSKQISWAIHASVRHLTVLTAAICGRFSAELLPDKARCSRWRG